MNVPNLINDKINIKIKLAFHWSSLMFLYIYADFFQLMTPNKLEKMMNLKTPMGPTSPGLLVIFSLILIVPAFMIVLSVLLKPVINKWLNIVVASLYACMSILIIFSTIGSEWHQFHILFNVLEVILFVSIVFNALKWSKYYN